MSDHKKDMEICEAATAGGWEASEGSTLITSGKGVLLGDIRFLVDIEFVTAFDPKRVMELLEAERERDELRSENEQLQGLLTVADERTALFHKEAEELRAHVARLREAWNKLQIITYHGEMTPEDRDECDSAFSMEPAQSLQAIRAEVEEEAIRACDDHMVNEYDFADAFDNMERKYKGE